MEWGNGNQRLEFDHFWSMINENDIMSAITGEYAQRSVKHRQSAPIEIKTWKLIKRHGSINCS